jgi:saccharopine dehydrogenase-like NADP-dependent oxidoreductase
VSAEALSDLEIVDLPGMPPLEAFLTDGLRTLLDTLDVPDVKERTLRYPGHARVVRALREAGFFGTEPVRAGDLRVRPIDLAARLLRAAWRYEEGEEDLVVLEHRFEADGADGLRRRITSRLVATGEAGDDSAMARTVGLPAALACGLILDGKTSLTGVQIPVAEELARPILAALAERGIEVVEETEEIREAAEA